MTLVASDVRRPGEPLVAGTRPSRSVPARPAKATSGESRGFGRWLLESGLYSLTLGYGSPRSFFAVAPDSWPGDPAIGQRLIMGELLARGSAGAVAPELRRPAVAAPGRADPVGRCPERLWLAARPARLRRPVGGRACRPPGRRLVELRGPLVARHLEARGAGRAHRLVDPPLRLAGHRRRPGLLRPLRVLARPPAHPSQARAAHRPGRPRGGRGAEGADLRRPGLPARRQARSRRTSSRRCRGSPSS